MYRIVVGDETLWTPTLENNNYLITDPTLTLESNKPSTLDFVVPNISVKKNLISLIRPEIKVYDNDRRIFRGRVLTNGKDFKRNRSIYCEGELSYLRDVIVRPTWTTGTKSVATYFEDMIAHYNATMNGISNYKKFVFGSCTVTGESIERENDQYPDMLSELTDKLLNKYGGYFVITVGAGETTYISYLQDPGTDDSVTIQYGRNLLDLSASEDATPVYTRIFPLGGQENNERVTIDDLYITTDDQTKLNAYGLIEHVETFDEIKDKAALETAGENALNEVAVSDSLEITALNSRMPDGSYGVLDCGKKYRILSAPHGYVDEDDMGRLNRQELKLNKPLESRYTFGKVKTGITQEAVSTNRAVDQVVKLAQLTSGEVTQIKTDVTALQTNVASLQTDVGTLKTKSAATVDYIVETGTQSGWKYKKWKSGLVECWASSLEVSMGNYATWTTDLLYATGSIAYPFTFSDSDDMDVLVNCTTKTGTTEVNGIILIAIKSTTGCQIHFVRKAAASTVYVNVYIRGTLATS